MIRLGTIAVVLLLLCGGGTAGRPVASDLAAGVEGAADGAVLRVAAGAHPGPIRVERPVTLVFEPGAVVVARHGEIGIEIVEADGVVLRGPVVQGGKHGIVIRHSTGVRISEAVLTGAEYHGIFAQDSEMAVDDCHVTGLRSALAQGVEIINSDGRPASSVRGCRVDGPAYEGIVSHVSKVTFADNTVLGTTERGVSITEMSQGRAIRNVVRDAAGTAFWCGDMSRCTFIDNAASGVAVSTPGFKTSEGHGLVVQFHSHAAVSGLWATGFAGRAVLVMDESVTTEVPSRLPAVWPLALFGVVLLGVPAALARLGGLKRWQLLLGTAFGVQLVHQGEHAAQVVQAKLLGRDAAHGIAGAAFDNEWVHLEFNTLLLAVLVIVVVAGRVRNRPMLFALAVQGYHEIEHVVKVVQYVRDAATPAPGLAGAAADLVWFHFSINLVVAVTIGLALRAALQMPSRRATSSSFSSGWTIAART